MNVCKGRCEALGQVGNKSGITYEDGKKRCTVCEIFFYPPISESFPSNLCLCCGIKLRTSPRGSIMYRKKRSKQQRLWRRVLLA